MMIKRILIFILLLILIIGCKKRNTENNTNNYFKNKKIDYSSQIIKDSENTVITANLGENFNDNSNYLYCITFQIVWNNFLDEHQINKLLFFDKDANIFANPLNSKIIGGDVISKDYYITYTGNTEKNNIEKFKKSMKRKFGKNINTDFLENLDESPDIKLFYSYLLKDIKYKYKFKILDDKIKFIDGENVKAFGFSKNDKGDYAEQREQLVLYDYKNNDDFILKINTKKDEIVLAKIDRLDNLYMTLNNVLERMKKNEESISENDELMIPFIGYDLTAQYDKIINKKIVNIDTEIIDARQRIMFLLTNEGVKLESEAFIQEKLAMKENMENKKLIFDKPFLLFMREKNSEMPYLIMWINNSELLFKE